MEKVRWNSIDKIKMDLNIQKMTNHPSSPDRKCLTHARISSTTLAHGNSNNEIRQSKVKSYTWPRTSQWRIYFHKMWGQLSTNCSNATEVAQWGASSCIPPQPATYNGVRDGRSNSLSVTPHLTQCSTPWAPRIARCKCGPQITSLAAATGTWTSDHRNARSTHCLCGHSGYEKIQTKTKSRKKWILK